MKMKRTKACVVEALFRTSFCTKTSTRFCTECGLALNADSIPRKKFFIFLVASAIEASSRRKTVSFTSSIPLESDKKNAHGQRRSISVTLRGTSFHSETGLWLKRKPFPHLRTEARSKRNRRVPIETRRGPIEATARQATVFG